MYISVHIICTCIEMYFYVCLYVYMRDCLVSKRKGLYGHFYGEFHVRGWAPPGALAEDDKASTGVCVCVCEGGGIQLA